MIFQTSIKYLGPVDKNCLISILKKQAEPNIIKVLKAPWVRSYELPKKPPETTGTVVR
jgi:hypothetical protein